MSAAQAIWRQPWLRRRNGSGLRWGGLGLLLLLAGAGFVAHWQRLGTAAWLGISALAMLTALWWATVDGLVQQNRPELARLLPGQLQALRHSLLLHAAAIGLAAWLCLRLLLGALPEWPWLMVATLVLMAWLLREPWLWVPVSLVPLLVMQLPFGPFKLARLASELPWAAQGALLGGAALLLLPLLGDGGPAHRRAFERQRRWQLSLRAQTEGRPTSAALLGPLARRLASVFSWPLRLHRQHLLRHPRADNLLQRMELGLMSGSQWPMLLWLGLLIGGLAAMVLLLVTRLSPMTDWARVVDSSRFGLCLGGFSLLCSTMLGRPAVLWGRRREQSLLVLLPGVATGAALASRLEARWRREYLVMWAVGTGVLLAFATQGSPATLDFVAAFAGCCLPLPWLAQWQHRRLSDAAPGFSLWTMAPVMSTLPALMSEFGGVPAWASLGAGASVYALCAWRHRPLARALLPIGR